MTLVLYCVGGGGISRTCLEGVGVEGVEVQDKSGEWEGRLALPEEVLRFEFVTRWVCSHTYVEFGVSVAFF